jgi:hypothetical protein
MCSSWCDSEFPRDDPEGTSTIGIRRIAGWGPNSSSWSSDRRIPRRLAKDKGPDRGPPPPESIGVPSVGEDAPRVAEIAAPTRGIGFASEVATCFEVSRRRIRRPTRRIRPRSEGRKDASTVMRARRASPSCSGSVGRRARRRPRPATSGSHAIAVTSRTSAEERESRILRGTVRHAPRKSAKGKRAPRSPSCFATQKMPRNRV